MQGVYRIRNKLDSKRYIGSAQDFDERWDTHRKELRKGTHYNPHLQNAWNKYGEENFVFEIEEEVKSSRKNAFDCEQEHLDEWFPTGLLYNVSPVVGGGATRGTGWHHTEEVRAEMSRTNSGKNHPMYGKHHSKESKQKNSKSNSGKNSWLYGKFGKDHPSYGNQHSKESRARQSKIMSGKNNPMYGKHHTKKTKAKQSKSSKGNKSAVKSYPAFYNIRTGEFVPAGQNLKKMCNEHNLNSTIMFNIKTRLTKRSHNGWELAGVDKSIAL